MRSASGLIPVEGAAFVCLSLLLATGCGEKSGKNETVTTAPPPTVDLQSHPTEGPHHGGLIELGDEEYHAEIVHDESVSSVTVYLLDSAAKASVSTEAESLAINLSHDGQAEQFGLSARPEPSNPVGTSSRFVSTDPELARELDHKGARAQLVVSINGKQYRGQIEHEHEGESHGEHDH